MRGKSFAHLFREIRKQGPSVATGLELLALVSHFTLWLVVPSLFFSFLPVLGVYLAVWGGVSLCLALIFIPAHVGMPVVTSYPDFVTLQMSSSRNYRPPRGLRWFCVGLQYQIEHHLFPTIPYIHLPLASEHARAWAAARGLPYRELTWLEGLRDSTRFLSQAWRTPAVQLGPERLAATPA
jgi:fatty acid desaturase